MKLIQTTAVVDRSAGLVESAFSMDTTAGAFEILSSGLYSDKPKAIIRELACNAYDSHVAAGRADRPIEIHLPSSLDLTFYVKDYGTGLSDYDVRGGWYNSETDHKVSDLDATMTAEEYMAAGYVRTTGVYNTYFRSTKTTSNEFIGQLGLGSKSPFSYASTFTVEVRYNGEIRTYTCYKNEELKPVITLRSVDTTTEENGVKVMMPIRREDIAKFTAAAQSALMYFNPAPDVRGVTNFTAHTVTHNMQGDYWRIRTESPNANMSGPYVIQGFVAYPIDVTLLAEHGLAGGALQVANVDIDLYVPIGDVTAAASREALQYNSHTIKNLIKVFQNAADEIRQTFVEKFAQCDTLYHANVLHDIYMYGQPASFINMYRAMHNEAPFMFEGRPVGSIVTLNGSACTNVIVHRIGRTSRKKTLNILGTWRLSTDGPDIDLHIHSNMHFVFVDKSRGTSMRLREYVDKLPIIHGRSPTLFVVQTISEQQADIARSQCRQLLQELSVDFVEYATLPVPARARYSRSSVTSTVRRSKEQLYVWSGFSTKTDYWGRTRVTRKYSRKCWDTRSVDLSAGGLYVPMFGFNVHGAPNGMDSQFDLFLSAAFALNLIDDIHVVGMRDQEQLAAIKAGGKWINVFDHVRAEFTKLNKTGAFNFVPNAVLIKQTVHANIRTGLIPAFKANPETLLDGPMKSFIDAYDAVVETAALYDSGHVNKLADILNVKINTKGENNDIGELYSTLMKEYPLLKPLVGPMSSELVPHVVSYINMVDQNRVEVNTKPEDIPEYIGEEA